jgi:CheY-like chemotaxis protein
MPYVLIVDNNPMNVEFIRYLPAARGYEVRTAPTVDLGLQMVMESAPALIISDLNLVQGSGFDFLRKIREQEEWKDIPFVLISASSYNQSDVATAKRLGAVKYIFRPIEPQAFLHEIEPYLKAIA